MDNKYKKSRYIKFAIIDGACYLYNLNTEAVLRFDQAAKDFIHLILEKPNVDYSNPDIERLHQTLINNGFLIPNDFDERAELRKRFLAAKTESRNFGLTIATTLQCNFRCPYCYEDHVSIYLDKETQNGIVAFVEKHVAKWNKLIVSWFGGEPLLRPEILKNLSTRLIEVCRGKQCEYGAFISTNGYLLSSKNAKLLQDACVTEVQVTIDGNRETHNARRFLIGGQGTYDQILSNVLENASYFERLIIRVNVDVQTIDDMLAVIENLLPVREKVWLSFMPVQSNQQLYKVNVKYSDFRANVHGLNAIAMEKGFRASPGFRRPGSTYCGSYQNNYLLIDARGDVFKCVVLTGRPEFRMGHLQPDGTVLMNNDLSACYSFDFDPFQDPECFNCEVLPVCMGGCQIMPADKKVESGRCALKDTLSENVEVIIQRKIGSHIVGRAAY
jgi:uncharacterized protein